MGRPSLRTQRRKELLLAFAEVLSIEGVSGATVAKVAAKAGVAPGLVHHHFESKDEMIEALLVTLLEAFRQGARAQPGENAVRSYGEAALGLGPRANAVFARAWVGLLAESLRKKHLAAKVRRALDTEIESLRTRSNAALLPKDASALLAYILGALVFGAFAPKRTRGFAAEGYAKLAQAMLAASLPNVPLQQRSAHVNRAVTEKSPRARASRSAAK